MYRLNCDDSLVTEIFRCFHYSQYKTRVDINMNIVHMVLNYYQFAIRLLRNVSKYYVLPVKFEYSSVPPSEFLNFVTTCLHQEFRKCKRNIK
jgi:hypothetical protein